MTSFGNYIFALGDIPNFREVLRKARNYGEVWIEKDKYTLHRCFQVSNLTKRKRKKSLSAGLFFARESAARKK